MHTFHPISSNQIKSIARTYICMYLPWCVCVCLCARFLCDTYGDKLMFSSFDFFVRSSQSYRCAGAVFGKCQLYSMRDTEEKAHEKNRERNGCFTFLCRYFRCLCVNSILCAATTTTATITKLRKHPSQSHQYLSICLHIIHIYGAC